MPIVELADLAQAFSGQALGLLLEETAGNIADLNAQNIPYVEYSDKAIPLFERARVVLGENPCP